MLWPTLFFAPALVYGLPQVTPTRPGGQKDGGGGFSLIRFSCSQVVIERLDPYVLDYSRKSGDYRSVSLTSPALRLVNPDVLPSPHVHQVVGGVSKKFPLSVSYRYAHTTRTRSMLPFPQPMSRLWLVARHAPSRMTFPTTGRRICTSRPATARSREFPRCRTGFSRGPRVERLFITLPPERARRLRSNRYGTVPVASRRDSRLTR